MKKGDYEFLDVRMADAIYTMRNLSRSALSLGVIALPCTLDNLIRSMDYFVNALESEWKLLEKEIE